MSATLVTEHVFQPAPSAGRRRSERPVLGSLQGRICLPNGSGLHGPRAAAGGRLDIPASRIHSLFTISKPIGRAASDPLFDQPNATRTTRPSSKEKRRRRQPSGHTLPRRGGLNWLATATTTHQRSRSLWSV